MLSIIWQFKFYSSTASQFYGTQLNGSRIQGPKHGSLQKGCGMCLVGSHQRAVFNKGSALRSMCINRFAQSLHRVFPKGPSTSMVYTSAQSHGIVTPLRPKYIPFIPTWTLRTLRGDSRGMHVVQIAMSSA